MFEFRELAMARVGAGTTGGGFVAHDESLTRVYSDRKYVSTTMVRHSGTTVAFAMDADRRIVYSVLDLEQASAKRGPLDARYWNEEPAVVPFPGELVEVPAPGAYAASGVLRMPWVRAGGRTEAVAGVPLPVEERDPFLSTTARLSAPAPFQVVSDGRYILLFRQGVDANHKDVVFYAEGGTVSGDRATAAAGTKATATAVVDGSLLCDRFVLVGSVLKPVVEVRYQRSRSKLRGASESDTLGTRDMEGNPFFEPTAKLSFVAPLQRGAFTVLLLPTAVVGESRWQVFAANKATGRVEGYNCAQGSDGLFDVVGAQLYTSPDPKFASSVLERGPGTCPHTKRPLVPVPATRDRAGTAMRFDPAKNTHVLLPAAPPGSATVASSGYTVEAWVRPAAASGTILAHHTGASPTSTFALELDADRKLVADLGGTRVVSGTAVPVNAYVHVAAVFDGKNAAVYVGGVRTGVRAVTAVPDARSAASVGTRLASGVPEAGFKGDVDEVRIWERARTEAEFGDRGRRLSGIEPGLAVYCRFDEGAGTVAGDHTRAMRDGTVHNGAVWVASDAPVGDGPGLSRDVFGFAGRAVSTGLAAVTYSQQEPATTGYGTAVGHEKRQTRVLVACGTSGPAPAGGAANRSYVAAVDFAVARDGRLAAIPSLVSLAEAGKSGAVGDAAAVAAAQAAVDAARASLDADRQLAAQVQQTLAAIDSYDRMFGPSFASIFGVHRRLQEQQAAQQRLGARQAAVDAAEDALMTVSGGTRGGGDTVVAMPVVSTDRQGLTVYGALLAFAWTEDAPFVLDGAGGDVVLYFRGGAGQFFSAYYSTLVTRATRSLGAGSDRLEFVARDTATRAKDFTVQVTADAGSAADLCTVTVTCGSRTETYLRVPRAAASLAAVLNGNPPAGTLLGTVLSVKDRLVELTAPLPAPLAVGSRVLVGGRVRKVDAAAPASATTFTVSGDAVIAAAGSQVTAVLYDYADATGSVTGTDLSSGSRIVAVTRVGSTTAVVADGDAKDAGDGVGPHWRGHAPGRAPAFDGTTQYLTAVDGADFATDGDLTLEAWLNPASATGTVLRAAGPATPYGLALRGTTLFSALSLEEDNVVECGDRLTLTGTSFTIEMWALRQATNRDDLLFSTGFGLMVGIDSNNRFMFGGDVGIPGQADLTWAMTTATVPAQEWHHWAVVHDASAGTRRVYRDGMEMACTSETGGAVAAGTFGGQSIAGSNDSRTVKLGFRAQGGSIGSRVCLDEVRVWGRARTADQIKETMRRRLRGREDDLLAYWQFSNGSTLDRSGRGNHGTLVGPFRSAASGLDGFAPVATVGSQTFALSEGVAIGDWSHVALAFKQHWAMAMDGAGHLDAGGPEGLNLLGDLTIEAGVRLDALGVVHGLVGKGVVEGGAAGTAVPYALLVEADGQLAFMFEKGGGGKDSLVTVRSGTKLQAGVFTRVAVTRKGGHNDRGGVAIRLYIDGAPVGHKPFVFEGAAPVGNDDNCELGRLRQGRTTSHLRGSLTDVRIWNVARDEKQIGAAITPKTPGLTAWWAFPEKEGAVTADACDTFPAKVRGARRVRTPDPNGNLATFYVDGSPQPAWIAPMHAQPTYPGEAHATIAGRRHSGTLANGYTGTIDEVRIWRTCRTREQILDNMFARLRGEKKDLVAHFPFDGASTQAGATVKDFGPRGNDLNPSPDAPRNTISSAPISADAAEVRSALTGIGSTFNARIDAPPAASEYGDLQADADGRAFGVMKRAYTFVRHGRWELHTGFKTGELTSTWVGQAQFDPQLVGFLEGAPPMPSENMVWGTAGDYAEKASVSFIQADSVTNTISNDEKRSLDASAKGKVEFWVNDDTSIVVAPLGVGTAKEAVKVKVGMTVEAEIKFSNGWATNLAVSQSTETTRTSGVVLTGQWEEDARTGQVNPDAGRRWVPANTGFAIVQSATADLYALRLAHTGVLVAYRMIPNADIPRDWNIIAFPINPRYTKQGTLDGLVGFAPKGSSGALQPFPDPAFPNAGDGGEHSYYRPREAYAIKRRIQREEQQLQSFYESVSTESATFAAHNPVRDQANRVLGGMMGGTGTGLTPDKTNPAEVRKAANSASRRHMVNTYVWTAAGGLFSETMSTTDQVTQVTTGDYTVSSSLSVGGFAEIEAGPVGVNLSGSVTLGGGYAVTRSKTKEAKRTFSLEVKAEPARDLQKREGDKPVFDIARNPVLVPGRVDAYRFMTFYLDSSTDNYEDFYGKVVDPEWLDRNTGPDARALRQTRQGDRKPPCWRILHRVTFVSRVQDTATATPSLAKAMGTLGITSDYHLMRQLEPHLAGATTDRAALTAAARTTLATRFPALAPYTDAIAERLTAYYNLPAETTPTLTPATPAPPSTPAATSTLTTAASTIAAGGTITLRYSTPAATLAATNWIGLYRDGTSPTNGSATDWKYAPDADGSLDFPAGGKLTPGNYRVWYLHNNGHTALAGPITLTIT
ncbi:LamG-like jellyroll fold domain-containing protein [Embleya sp. NPDC127516]|uniref:LamG domain-containing protein n=1 Tax=Embleya sp. NPDC127516 TaxID=3363990 RepID=UPI003818367E